ncbi:membrane protein [Streptomyces thioluteus]|uniref:Membrane protein n=1 Tax=Streptomyces thioluteus TaxID=66431 RepID=A0ABP6IWN0_STRTU
MGIESDQLVYDYLSRVGDIAQRESLTSGDRMRLVSRLRTEIERRRATEGAETPAAVRRILDGLGPPERAVADAGTSPGTGRVPEQRRGPETGGAVHFPDAGAPPHLATEEELGRSRPAADDWWSVGGGPVLPAGEPIHGFTGGIEIPDMLRPPQPSEEDERPPTATASAAEEAPAEQSPRRRFPLARRGAAARVPAGTVPMSPLLVLVAILLVIGAIIGNWLVLVVGWALAYITRRLSQNESKWAVMGVPGLAAAGGVAWLWGRLDHRWGDPIPQGGLGAALADTLPVVVRVAALASAAYVLWRARRPG